MGKETDKDRDGEEAESSAHSALFTIARRMTGRFKRLRSGRRPTFFSLAWWTKKRILAAASVALAGIVVAGTVAYNTVAMQESADGAAAHAASDVQAGKPQPHSAKPDGQEAGKADSGVKGEGGDQSKAADGKDAPAQSSSSDNGSSAGSNNTPTPAGGTGTGGNADSVPVASNGSGSTGGSDTPTPPSGGGNSSPTPSPSPSDPHAGKTWHEAVYDRQWVPNVVTVTDSPAWDEQVQTETGSQYVFGDGYTCSTDDEASDYIDSFHSQGINAPNYSVQPVYAYSTIHHPAITHSEDKGHYENVLVKDAGWY